MKELVVANNIKSKIHTIRGLQVMLDSDLAELYDVETKQINRAVKRNKERFPNNFMFQLTEHEVEILRSQIATLKTDDFLRFQNGTLENGRGKHRKYLPHVFTEQGVSMLSGVLRSETAIKISIKIMDAFVSMRKFISANAQIFTRLDNVERKQISFEIKTEKNFDKVFDALQTEKPKQGIFYDGQVFDAYKFVSDLTRSAKKSIVLIDNYIDDSVFTLFSKRKKDVSVVIYTKNISPQLRLDLEKFNSQYIEIKVKKFNNAHDRFMIIDKKDIYHFGASLKDLGKKWFAFSRFEKGAVEMLGRLG